MARIELRNTTVKIRDGFGGSAAVDDSAIAGGNTTIEIDTVANLTNSLTTVPVGARFTIAGVSETYVVTGQKANKVFQVVVDAASGTFTITFNGQTTAAIDFDATATEVKDALELLSNVDADDLLVTSPVTSTWVIECQGQYLGLSTPTLTADDVDLTGGGDTVDVTTLRPGATTWELTFTPPLDMADLPSNDDVVTFLPQELSIKIGDGDLTYTENDEYLYDLDRDVLDTVRKGQDQPMEVSLNFTYEHITTGTGESIAPMDAIKKRGGASGWVSAATDKCEPYCVDIVVEHTPPCGTDESETTTFPDFRSESREVSFRDANISVSGRCNATEPIVSRA